MELREISNEHTSKVHPASQNEDVNEVKARIEKPNNKAILDDILVNDLGQFGRYQLITLLLLVFPIIFEVFSSAEYVFTAARIKTRCRISECDGAEPEITPSWLLNAIPGTSLESFESCERYASTANTSAVTEGTCPAALFNQDLRENCEAYVYESQFSVVYEFNLACQEWRRAFIGCARTIGFLIAFPITGYISDRWGRKTAMILNAFNTAWIGLVRAAVDSYEWFVALNFIEATFGSGAFSSSYILVLELAGPQYRVLAGGAVDTAYAIAEMILGCIAAKVGTWRILTLVAHAPLLLIGSYYWLITESVRWLMSKGRYAESEQILQKIAKVNKKELSAKSLESLTNSCLAAEADKRSKLKEPWLPILVFKSPTILYRCVVSPIWWITATMVYYGMTINSVDLIGNSYVNFIAVTAIEIPGIWTTILLLNRIGRKPMLISAYWLCAACQFAFAFLEVISGVRAALYLFGKFCISIVMTSVYIYTAELYPTRYRHSLFAFSSTIGRLGSISAPLMPAFALKIWQPLPSVLFGSFAVLSGVLVFTTPETLGTKLPDTFEEAEQLGKKNPSS